MHRRMQYMFVYRKQKQKKTKSNFFTGERKRKSIELVAVCDDDHTIKLSLVHGQSPRELITKIAMSSPDFKLSSVWDVHSVWVKTNPVEKCYTVSSR